MADHANPLRHGCWLGVVIVAVTMVVLVVVGLFGLVGPVELAIIIVAVSVGVIAVDRWRASLDR